MASPMSFKEPWDLVADAYVGDVAPQLAKFAVDALDWAEIGGGERVLDVATGPGTLAVLAAERGADVDAIDFAPAMIAQLEQRLARLPLPRLRPQVADGMSLPFDDGRFDAAFSMFGLMFFSDRARGLAELKRVLRHGGRAVISSWGPLSDVPLLAEAFAALAIALPELPPPPASMPLGDADACRSELTQAGFRAIEVRSIAHEQAHPSAEAAWEVFQRSSAPFARLRQHYGAARWDEVSAAIRARLVERFGHGPQVMRTSAWMTLGVA